MNAQRKPKVKQPKIGDEVTIKLANESAIMQGPYAKQAPKFIYLRGVVQSRPEWESNVDTMCLLVKDSPVAIRLVHMSKVLEINGEVPEPFVETSGIETHTIKGSKGDEYIVRREGDKWSCSCPGFSFRHHCKHIDAAKNK